MGNAPSPGAGTPGTPGTHPPHDGCQAIGCKDRWAVLLFAGDISLAIREALFGLEAGQCETVRMCWKHYKIIHRKDGITLGYRSMNGKIRAYVKEVHY